MLLFLPCVYHSHYTAHSLVSCLERVALYKQHVACQSVGGFLYLSCHFLQAYVGVCYVFLRHSERCFLPYHERLAS